ncbi:hypothetical protein J5N97_011121 [Dioscorea zingiberensis]|uniref:X8 domain-containing protein n=1 Tax=Dioscorea zingiberensis TaxID=325984 RepID=A0A9D5D009_9LILI|nr:hypothetical protein J5N97_011121 [Dioscorea zingiberensis]
MEPRDVCLGLLYLLLFLSTATNFPIHSEARRHKNNKQMKALIHFEAEAYSSSDPYSNSLPPFEDLMGPSSSHENINSPFCVYPPSAPSPPSTSLQPPSPESIHKPPPGTPEQYKPSPPVYYRSPPEFVPGTPVFLPPIVYPPPSVPPPPYHGTTPALWCVAKPTVPDPIIQEAMNYACGSGADCAAIQPNGVCFQPDTLISHASFAFNSYWQRTKVAGGTCDFGDVAMLITRDPSKLN